MMSALTGTTPLLRLAWRRDRVLIPVSVLVYVAMAAASMKAVVDLYPDEASRITIARVSESMPATVALYGHVYDLRSLGSIGTPKLLVIGLIWIAVLCIALVRRHTRAEEESGRLELVGSTVMGRKAPLAAAVLLASGTAIALGTLTAVACVSVGLDVPGSVAFGLAHTMAGLVWTGIAAVAAQLTQNNRTVGAIAFASLGIAYLLRMIGDLQEGHGLGATTWLSPLGWSQQVRPYADNRWWVALIALAASAALVAIASLVLDRRDLGAGLVAERPGPARGTVGSALALGRRLHRGPVIGWTLALLAVGVVLGLIAQNVSSFVTDQGTLDILRKMGGAGALSDLYISVEATFMGLLAACFGVASLLRLRTEETSGHAEAILSTGTSRHAFVGSHTLPAFAGSALLLLATGLGMGAAHALSTHDTTVLATDVAAMMVQLPAVWVMIGLSLLLTGWLPGWSVPLSWSLLAAFVLIGQFGELLSLPTLAQQISPFAHTPRLPAQSFTLAPVTALLALTLACAGAGFVGFRRRDLSS